MKILYLYNHRLFMGFENSVEIQLNLRNHTDFYTYGPYHASHYAYSDEMKDKIEPVPYDEKIQAEDLINIFRPDVILMSYKEELEYWIPSDLHKVDVPVISIEADYQLHENDPDWFKKYVDLIIIMSYFDHTPVESVWWPFSVRDDIVKQIDINREREDKIFFMGSLNVDWYKIRRNALIELANDNLVYFNKEKISINDYLSMMCNYIGTLTCSSVYHTPLAKMFEGMLTKTAVLTNWFKGSENLFGDLKPYYEYKDDCSNICDVARELINNNDKRIEIVDKAYKIVSEKHTASHRLAELHNIIDNFVKTGNIIRKWGH